MLIYIAHDQKDSNVPEYNVHRICLENMYLNGAWKCQSCSQSHAKSPVVRSIDRPAKQRKPDGR